MRELEYPFDNNFILRKRKTLKTRLLNDGRDRTKVKIAILGGSTTVDIADILGLFLLNEEIEPVLYESEYGRYWEDAVFGNNELDTFQPDVIVIHTSIRNIQSWPETGDSAEKVSHMLTDEFSRLETMWKALEERYHAVIIQNNYERPLIGTSSNQDVADYGGHANYIIRLNSLIYQYKQEHSRFYIHDVEGLSAEYGLRKWQDFRTWYLYKYVMPIEAIPEFSFHLCAIIKSLYGKNKKVLVLDADNTLWGGIIGECGVEGIVIGNETSEGQSYTEWQSYIKRLKKQGILLAVASKNEEKSVMEGLLHPDMVLKASDFSAMAVNWEDKAANLTVLSQKLNIGLNYFVFVDDNPAERERVRQSLPEVLVLEANCPEEFLTILAKSQLFGASQVTDEDMKRAQMYAENEKREDEKKKFVDYQEYLRSLDMEADIAPFCPIYYARITQLINKTNQFNLTTWRLMEDEVKKYAENQEWICLYGRLTDRFGDNGIVGIVMAEKIGTDVHIREFLLSCRAFKRQMEYALLDSLVMYCRKIGIKKAIGYYHPTKKNKLVENFYGAVGFKKKVLDDEEIIVWELEVKDYEVRNNVIRMKGEL